MRPLPVEARQQIFELRQLDLQLALVAARSLGKYVEDELAPVDYANVERVFQIALLSGRQIFVQNDQIGMKLFHFSLDLVNLAAADQSCWSNIFNLLMLFLEHRRACGFREAFKFFETIG